MSEKDIKTQQEQEVGDITGLINPFPGLRPFGVEESHLFFGDSVADGYPCSRLESQKISGAAVAEVRTAEGDV